MARMTAIMCGSGWTSGNSTACSWLLLREFFSGCYFENFAIFSDIYQQLIPRWLLLNNSQLSASGTASIRAKQPARHVHDRQCERAKAHIAYASNARLQHYPDGLNQPRGEPTGRPNGGAIFGLYQTVQRKKRTAPRPRLAKACIWALSNTWLAAATSMVSRSSSSVSRPSTTNSITCQPAGSAPA